MRKQWIACVLVVSVMVPASAWAQKLSPEGEARMREFCLQNKNAPGIEESCVRDGYLPPPTTKWLSPGLAVTGILVTAAGAGLALNWGHQNVDFLDDTYCVSDYGDVAYGSCGSWTQTKIGLLMMGAGVGMAVIGAHKVQISPMIGHGVKGVSGTIKWGGKHDKR